MFEWWLWLAVMLNSIAIIFLSKAVMELRK